MPVQYAYVLKIGVLRNNGEAVVFRILPNGGIIRTSQSAGMDVSGTCIKIGQGFRQTRGQVFVEEEFHAFEMSALRSRSAAYARQARMSSSVR